MIVLERKCAIWKITNGEIVEIRIGNEVFKKSYIVDTLPVLKEKQPVRKHEKRAGEKHIVTNIDWSKYWDDIKEQAKEIVEEKEQIDKIAGKQKEQKPGKDVKIIDENYLISSGKKTKRKRVKAVGSGRRTLLETHLDNYPELGGFTIQQIKNTIPYYGENDRNSERLDRIISSMIETKRIFQIGKDRFKVASK